MALTEFEIKRYQKIVDDFSFECLSYGYSDWISGCSFEESGCVTIEMFSFYECSEINSGSDRVKAEFSEVDKVWSIYFEDSENEWKSYDPLSKVRRLSDFLEVVRFFLINRSFLILNS